MNISILLFVLTFFLASCASNSPAPTAEQAANARIQDQMQTGLKALEHEDYSGAAGVFDRMLVQRPASEFDLIILYNDGVAHEGMGECKKAADLYRQAIQGAIAMKRARVEAESMYRLSFAYECAGQDRKAVAALLDARKRSANLTPEVAEAELPARLASAYARIGERGKATKFFKEALNGLKRALSSVGGTTSRVQQKFAARTLYSMGQLTARQRGLNIDPYVFLKSLSIQQPYLLQAAEQAVIPDSQKAADELIFAYESVGKLMPNEPAKARPFLELALQDMAELKKIRMPGKGSLVDEIYDRVEIQESRVRQMLTAESEATPLTDAAKKREGLRRQGHTVGSSPLDKAQ